MKISSTHAINNKWIFSKKKQLISKALWKMTKVGKWDAARENTEYPSRYNTVIIHVFTDSTARLIARFAFRGNNYRVIIDVRMCGVVQHEVLYA